jgi:hypothetical protein
MEQKKKSDVETQKGTLFSFEVLMSAKTTSENNNNKKKKETRVEVR